MALKSIMLRHKIDKLNSQMETLRAKDVAFSTREAELEKAIAEASNDEEETAVSEEIEKFDTEKSEHEAEKVRLSSEIEKLETELKESEQELEAQPAEPAEKETHEAERGKKNMNETRTKFFGMNAQQRDAFMAREDVKSFLSRVREMGAGSEKRSVSGADLTIPTVVLDLIRENIMDYSKLMRHVRLRAVSGKARQNVMGNIPEAVWTEACAKINDLTFAINQVETDGYKVSGIIYICKANLEDSDLNLATEIITDLGASIGMALDKAILYGTGKKMPMGIVPRLAQSAKPDNYPENARPWQDLHTSNMINLGDKHGIELFQAIGLAAGKMKGKYSRGNKFWAMNESTYNTLLVEAMSINASGAIVSGMNGTMPVLGGDVEVLSDDIIADGNIVAGYGDLYLLAERAGSLFERSDEYRFAEDQVAFKGSARYDGVPVVAEAFVAMALNAAPQSSTKFAGNDANDATLTDISIGDKSLSPAFSTDKLAYTVTTTDTSNAVNASPAQANASVVLAYNGKNYPNGADIKWTTGTKPLSVIVTNGNATLTYTVNVTKS